MTEQDKLHFAKALAERHAQLKTQVKQESDMDALVKLQKLEKVINDFSEELKSLVHDEIRRMED